MAIDRDFLRKLKRKVYRRSHLREGVTSWIVYQIKALRDQRQWTQAQLGEAMGDKPQSRVAQIESPDYGKWTVSTLLDVAEAFDVALQVRFVSWPDYLRQTDDLSLRGMYVSSFSERLEHAPSASTDRTRLSPQKA